MDLPRLALGFLPLWTVYVVTVILFLLVAEAGFRLSKFMQRKWPDKSESGVGTMVGAMLALLAFLIAFTTSIALNLVSNRRQLLVNEANAIGTTYLRAGYLPQPLSDESRSLLRDYVDERLASVGNPEQIVPLLQRSEEIHNELWARAETLAREYPSPMSSLYVSSLNDVIDLHAERVNAELVVRVPPPMVLGLYLIGFLTLLMVGIQAGYADSRNWLALVAMVLVLSTVYYLIIDLDRNQQGLIQVSQQAMLDLQRQINAGP